MASKVNGLIQKVDPGNSTQYSIASTAYGVCETAADTTAKTVDMTGFTLIEGTTVHIRFVNKNTAANPTLNINGTGAYPIRLYGTTVAGTLDDVDGWKAGALLTLTFISENTENGGPCWVRNQSFTRNLGNAKIFYGTCSTAAATLEKTVLCPDFTSADLVSGAIIFVTFSTTNSGAVGSITMNVQGTGAKGIKELRNASVSNLPGVGYIVGGQTYMFYYNGTYWVALMNYDSNSNTAQRTFRSSTNVELPIAGINTGNATAAYAAINSGSYKDLYAAIPETVANLATINPSTGKITVPGGIVGNASTATKLATARSISLSGDATGSTTFDGSANATISTLVVKMASRGRRTSVESIAVNPTTTEGNSRMTWHFSDSSSRNNDATNSPSFDAAVINLPWDWGAYNGQIAIANTVTTPRMQIRSAAHTDNGAEAEPRYTPNYGAWREVVTATKDTQMGNATKPIYISNTGQVVEGTAIGASAYHADSYFALSGHDHSGVYLPLAGGTMTGTITLGNVGLKTPNTNGYTTDDCGNFKHQITDAGNFFHIDSNNGTPRFKIVWETGQTTITAAKAKDTGVFNVVNTNSLASGDFSWAINSTAANMAAGSNNVMVIGQADSKGNAAYYGFHYEGSDSASSYASLGIYGYNHLVKLYKTGDMDLTGGIRRYYSAASTSPAISVVSNNQDVNAMWIGHGTAYGNPSGNYYKFVYKGTGTSPNNYFQLVSAVSSSTEVVAMQVDESGNVSFTNTVAASISGNAATATKATQDGSGNNIVNTYLTKAAGVTAVTWDSTNKKITRTINGTAADVVQFVAGSNVTLTAESGKLTIASSYTNSRDPGYGKIKAGTASTAVTGITANTSTAEAKTYNETLTINPGNKWIAVAATNSSTAGSDTFTIGHAVPSSITNSGPSSAQTPGYGSTFNIPVVSLDEAGHVTGISTTTVKIPASDNVDTKVNQTIVDSSNTNDYRILLSGTADDTTRAEGANKNTNLRFKPSTQTLSVGGSITATGNLSITGNATLSGETNAASLTAGQLLVTGSASFTQIPTAPTPASTSNDTSVATTAFVKNAFLANDAMVFKGTVAGTSSSPGGYTVAANRGDTYKVSTAGYVNGVKVEVGDTFICTTDNTAAATSSNYSTVQANWIVLQTNIDGYVIGPASSTANAIAIYSGTTGKTIADSAKTLTTTAPSSSSADTTIPTSKAVWSAISNGIGALDVSSVGGTGKYISAISETDGKISATVSDTTVSNTWTGGTTAGPTIKTTVNGVTGTAVAIPSATASASGVVTTTTQSFAGSKTFESADTFEVRANVIRFRNKSNNNTQAGSNPYVTSLLIGDGREVTIDEYGDGYLGIHSKYGILLQSNSTDIKVYDATKTYSVGNIVWYDRKYYICTTAITEAQEWTAANWTQIPAGSGTIVVDGTLQPITTNSKSLGTSTYRWKNLFIGTADSYGSATEPIYWSSGVPTKGDKYAGGTAVTLNNSSKAGSTASFYAPTAGGTANTQALVGNGATAAPKWVNISPSITITAGTSSAAPKINVIVLGQSGTAQAITTASTSVYGVTKLNSATNSTSTTEAATPSAVKAAYDLANNHKYWADVEATSAAAYNKAPEMATLKLNGNTSATAASTSNVSLIFDTTTKALNFVFA